MVYCRDFLLGNLFFKNSFIGSTICFCKKDGERFSEFFLSECLEAVAEGFLGATFLLLGMVVGVIVSGFFGERKLVIGVYHLLDCLGPAEWAAEVLEETVLCCAACREMLKKSISRNVASPCQ